MKHLYAIWRKLKPLAAVVACWLALYGTALARGATKKVEEQPTAGSWVSSYGLVLLGIVLGMLGVCLSSRRREREKPETYAKTKLVQDGKKN
jgi:hypothetical protein